MYQNFYGLNQLPFDSSLDGTCFFAGGQRQEILDALLYFTERGEKMVIVTGESGVGKTALIAALQLRLPERVSRVQLTGPYLMQQELQEALLAYLGIKTEFGDDKQGILVSYLQQMVDQSTPLLLIVDDAHKLSQASLAFLLSLAGISAQSSSSLVRLMLFGMPDLSKMLLLSQDPNTADPAAFRARLNAFSVDELFFYLEQRLRCAGYQGESLFEPAVVKAIFHVTKGVPRAVNSMVDQLFMAGYSKGSRTITLQDIHALGYHTQLGFGHGFTYDNDKGILQTMIGYLTKPPIIITLVTGFVVGLSLLAGYVISDYLMINHSSKEEIGKSAIVNSMSIDPPMPDSALPSSDLSHSLSDPLQPNLTAQTSPVTLPTPAVEAPPLVKPSTPPAKALQSETLPKTTPPATAPKPSNSTDKDKVENKPENKADSKVADKANKTETSKSETTKPDAVTAQKTEQPKPVAPQKPTEQKPTVTPASTTLSSSEEVQHNWPINGTWQKHHSETLAQLKRLQRQGATHTVQLLSDAWRSRDAFVGLAQGKLNALPAQSSYLVDYQLEDGRPRVALVYGAYSGLESAQAAVKNFPEEVAKYKPMLKRLDSVIAQMEGFRPPE